MVSSCSLADSINLSSKGYDISEKHFLLQGLRQIDADSVYVSAWSGQSYGNGIQGPVRWIG